MAPERDVFVNFDRMRREIDELFGDMFERSGFASRHGFSPRVDVYYCGTPPRAVVKAEIAGVSIGRVGVEIRGRQLVLTGEREPRDSEGRLYQQMEIEQGVFRRVVELGSDVVPDAATATYEDGILRVEIPLVEREGGVRQVPIEARAEGDSQ